jgi:hypothetical protein
MAASAWASPEIDTRIVALKQKGLSHTRIAREIVAEFGVFVNKNMVLRRARTILGIDRGEKAANERLERKRKAEKAERAARLPKEPAPRPVNVPPPAVTLPPLPSVRCHPNTCEHECLGLGYCVRMTEAPRLALPPPVPPLGSGKCAFPLWPNGATPSHEYCGKRTPLGSSWCASCRAVVWHTYRQARAA